MGFSVFSSKGQYFLIEIIPLAVSLKLGGKLGGKKKIDLKNKALTY